MTITTRTNHADASKNDRRSKRNLPRYPDKQAVCIDAMKIVQRHRGWVSDESVRDIGELLDMISRRTRRSGNLLQPGLPQARRTACRLICDSVSCWIMGYERHAEHLTSGSGSSFGENTPDNRFTLLPIVCLGACDHAPAMMVDDELHTDLEPGPNRRSAGGIQIAVTHGETTHEEHSRSTARRSDLHGLREGGWLPGIAQSFAQMTPAEVLQELVKKSNLRGRGGAGFPTGMKWSFVPMGDDAPHPKYLVANADEMEPGTFKDRLLMEGDPHQLIEGMILAAYAIQADVAYHLSARGIQTGRRNAWPRRSPRLMRAGYLGKNILGSDFSLRDAPACQRWPLHVRRRNWTAECT